MPLSRYITPSTISDAMPKMIRCADLGSIRVGGKTYWLEAKFVSENDAAWYVHDQMHNTGGTYRYGDVDCRIRGCSGHFGAWCRAESVTHLEWDNAKRKHRKVEGPLKPPRNRKIPFYSLPGQYIGIRERKVLDRENWTHDERYPKYCNHPPEKCPPKEIPLNLSDFNQQPSLGDNRQLPPGIPDWALVQLLTSGAIILYLLFRNLRS